MDNQREHPLISYQPFNILFRLVYLSAVVIRVPLWLLSALVSPLRPHPKWTAKQTLLCRIAYVITDIRSRIGITEGLSLQPGKEGDRFQIIKVSPSDFYQGPLSSKTRPEIVGATWFPKALDSKDVGSKVVALYIHGGAFVQENGRDIACGFAANTMIERGRVDAVLSLQYRLSGYSGRNPFPAALQDTLTAYLFLLHTLNIPPHQIVLCGDSAGGNLVIALLRYIHEFGASLNIPSPRCAALFSPWVTPSEYNITNHSRAHSDFIPSSFLRWGAMTYTAGLPNAASHPYITPLGNPFKTTAPIFVNVGTAEIFLDDVQKWVKEMQKIQGNQIHLNAEDAALHDTFLLGGVLGFEKSAQEAISEMGAFIRKC